MFCFVSGTCGTSETFIIIREWVHLQCLPKFTSISYLEPKIQGFSISPGYRIKTIERKRIQTQNYGLSCMCPLVSFDRFEYNAETPYSTHVITLKLFISCMYSHVSKERYPVGLFEQLNTDSTFEWSVFSTSRENSCCCKDCIWMVYHPYVSTCVGRTRCSDDEMTKLL